MKRAAAALAWAVLLAAPAFAQKDPQPLSTDELSARAARPLIILAPKYPSAAAQDKIEATVDIFGTVRPDGSFDVKRIEASPDREDFKAAVRDVLDYWALSPAYGADCRPIPAEGQVRVWFELKEGRGPVISVSRSTRAVEPPAPEGLAKVRLKAVTRVHPEYPRAAIRANVQGSIESYLRVSAEGSVEEVVIAPSPMPAQFASSVRTALARWRFEPRPGEPAVCALYEVVFRLRD